MKGQTEAKTETEVGRPGKKFGVFRLIENKTSVVETCLNLTSAVIIVFLMLFVTAEVVGRYVFNHPIQGHYDIVVVVMAPLVFFGLAHTERIGGHIRMELFITKVPKGRVYHGLEILLLFICLALVGAFVSEGTKYTLFMYQMGYESQLIRLPLWPFQLTVVIGCAFLCFRFLIEIIQHLARLVAGVGNKHPSE